MRISDWSSDVCSSDLVVTGFDTDAPVIGGSGGDVIDIAGLLDRDTDFTGITLAEAQNQGYVDLLQNGDHTEIRVDVNGGGDSYSVLVATLINTKATELNNSNLVVDRSDEHTSELQSLMRISYAVFCLNKKK